MINIFDNIITRKEEERTHRKHNDKSLKSIIEPDQKKTVNH